MSNENTPVDAPSTGEEKKAAKKSRSRKKNPVPKAEDSQAVSQEAPQNEVMDAPKDAKSADETPAESKKTSKRVKQAAKSSSDAEMQKQKPQRRSRKVQTKAVSKEEGVSKPKNRNQRKKTEETSSVPEEISHTKSPDAPPDKTTNGAPDEIFHTDLTGDADQNLSTDGTDTAGAPTGETLAKKEALQPENHASQGHTGHRNIRRSRRGKKQEMPPPQSTQVSEADKQNTTADLPVNLALPLSQDELREPAEASESPEQIPDRPQPQSSMLQHDSDESQTIQKEAENTGTDTSTDTDTTAGPDSNVDDDEKASELDDPWDSEEFISHTEALSADSAYEGWDDETPSFITTQGFVDNDLAHDEWDDGYEILAQGYGKKDQNGNESVLDSDEDIHADSDDALKTKPKKHQKNKNSRSRNRKARGEDDAQETDEADEGTEKEAVESEIFGDENENSAEYESISFLDDDDEENGQSKRKETQHKANRKMFFSVLAGERIEVALTQEGKLCEYYLDMQHQKKLKGNIYKGIIQNIDANLQAAFVDYGTMKNGFLQIDEIHSEYWLAHHEPTKGNKFPPIQKVIKPGQEVLVQVVKEPTGNKGAFLTTWLSLAGRFLVLTPGQDQIGVSRKVEDESERARLKDLINGIDPGEDMGVIVRTVSEGTTKETLKKDLVYLKRIWQEIREKGTEVKAPALIYKEPGLVERAIREYLTEDVSEIWVDSEEVAETIHSMVDLLFPRKKDLVHLFLDKKQSLWDRFNIRRQIEQVYSREVFLPSGGRLVFDQTEALMAIDVNSGKISCKGNFETMAFKTNMEAAESIARQLRLRDVGGQVVIDFIEMREKKHVEEVERSLRLAMKSDRARYDIEHMSSFGLLELVRQRTGFSALSITQEPCPFCSGTGQRRNLEWQALQVATDIQRQMRSSRSQHCIFETNPELGMYLLNHKRDMLQELEQMFGKTLEISIHRSL